MYIEITYLIAYMDAAMEFQRIKMTTRGVPGMAIVRLNMRLKYED
jgi:hypothetical protein